MAAGSPSELNRLNVLKSIIETNSFTRMDIVRRVHLSHPTVHNILERLVTDGYVIEVGNGQSRGGRPPVVYRFNPHARYAVGVEFRIPKLAIGLVDLTGNLIAIEEYPFGDDADNDYVMCVLDEGIEHLLQTHDVANEKLVGIGMGIPGFVDSNTGVWLRYPRVPNLRDIPIHTRLTQRFGVPAFIENEANVYAIAELQHADRAPQSDTLYVTWSEGIKSSVYIDGKILSGRYGNFGAVGHFIVVEEGRPCYCGSQGCLEMYASGYAFRDAIKARFGSAPPSFNGRILEPVDIFPLAELGDATARNIVEEAIPHVASALASLVRLTDITQMVLLGTFVRGGDFLLSQLYDNLARRLPSVVRRDLTVRLGGRYTMEEIVCAAAVPALKNHLSTDAVVA